MLFFVFVLLDIGRLFRMYVSVILCHLSVLQNSQQVHFHILLLTLYFSLFLRRLILIRRFLQCLIHFLSFLSWTSLHSQFLLSLCEFELDALDPFLVC